MTTYNISGSLVLSISGTLVVEEAGGGGLIPAFVQEVVSGATPSNATTLVLTLSGVTTTAGNHLVVCCSSRSGTVTGVVDSKGNTWQVDETVSVTGASAAIASCKIVTPLVNADTITITVSGAGTGIAANAVEFSGLASSDWADVQASAGNAVVGMAADSGATATSAVANSLVIGVVGHQQTVTSFAAEVLSPVWNLGTTTASIGSVQRSHPMYRVVAETGAYSCEATWTVSTRIWAAAVAVYKGG